MKLSRKQWIPIGILLLFIITNPSASAFKEYIGSNTYSGLKRTTNLFVCSVYKHYGSEYFGIFGNFIELKEPEIKHDTVKEYINDNTMVDTNMKDTSVHDPLGILKPKK